MPNTNPTVDTRSVVEFVLQQARVAGMARVYPIVAATKGQKGKVLTEYHDLVDAGAVAVSDDGSPVAGADMVRRVFEYASVAGIPLIEHCEDMAASGDGVINEGFTSTRLGLPGIPAWSETLCLARDLIVLESVRGARLHAAHVSARGSIEHIRWAKERGLAVTAETAPHYICLEDKDLETWNTNLKINPPLRTKVDCEAMIEALKDGTIDCIASDHAPHAAQDKEVELSAAPPGTLPRALSLITYKPADCIGIPGGTLARGAAADLVLFDPDEEWTVDARALHSKSKNTAFHGHTVYGRARHTILGGMRTNPSPVGV